jgi:hypothetical protein
VLTTRPGHSVDVGNIIAIMKAEGVKLGLQQFQPLFKKLTIYFEIVTLAINSSTTIFIFGRAWVRLP